TVTQFVVGQWTVKNTQAVPQGYGRQSSYSEYGFSGVTDFLNNIGSNPYYQFVIVGIIIIILGGMIIWKFPEVVGLVNKSAKSASSRIKTSRRKSKKKT
ncbi:MAG: hypothetical protein WC325_10420, partial [Candidatus Bathyarchaeia archaeon]